tara:strand:- start:192 stop:380 length:189 start_codon:yes stop_codon:yes gene_type:complete
LISLSHESLVNFYQTNFQLVHHFKYSLTEIENMVPWEREVYLTMLINHLKEEAEKAKAKQRK